MGPPLQPSALKRDLSLVDKSTFPLFPPLLLSLLLDIFFFFFPNHCSSKLPHLIDLFPFKLSALFTPWLSHFRRRRLLLLLLLLSSPSSSFFSSRPLHHSCPLTPASWTLFFTSFPFSRFRVFIFFFFSLWLAGPLLFKIFFLSLIIHSISFWVGILYRVLVCTLFLLFPFRLYSGYHIPGQLHWIISSPRKIG